MIPLIDEESKSYEKQKICYICKKEFNTDENGKNEFNTDENDKNEFDTDENGDINKLVLLLRKGVDSYEYMESWKRFDETSVPDKKAFYSELYLEDITDEDYAHAQKVFEKLKLKSLGDQHDLYVQSDTLLLADVFENFKTSVLKYMNLILLIFYQHQD